MTPALHRRRGLPGPLRVLFALLSDDPDDVRSELGKLFTHDGNSEETAEELLLRAEWEGATPLLARRLIRETHDPAFARLPDRAHSTLDHLGIIREFRLRELHARLDRLLDSFEKAGIGTLLLKGAVMARCYHDSAIERPMADVDVVVAPERLDMARRIAHELGWTHPAHVAPAEAYADHHHLPPMGDATGIGLMLELHTSILPDPHPYGLDLGRMRVHSEPLPADLSHPNCRIPGPEHLLIHNAVHLFWSHLCSSGLWKALSDSRTLIRSGRLDDEALLAEAEHTRTGIELHWLLELTGRWTDTSVPASLLERLPSLPPEPVQKLLARHFAAASGPRSDRVPVALRRKLWEIAMRPTRNGHGDLRPWNDHAKWTSPEALPTESSAPPTGRLGKTLGSLGYLAGLVRAT